jgi:hypothetical protein
MVQHYQFGDDVWDFSPYLPKCHCKLNFDSWLEDAREDDFLLSNTCRNEKIIFALLYIKSGKSIIKSIEQRHTCFAPVCCNCIPQWLYIAAVI